MSPSHLVGLERHWRFPRVSGDEPLGHRAGERGLMFSPRERG